MSLLVLGQVTRSFELFVADLAWVHDVSRSVGLAATSHGAMNIVFVILIIGEGTLQHRGFFVEVAVVRKRNDLSILVSDKLGGLPILGKTALNGYFFITIDGVKRHIQVGKRGRSLK
jgi:hypothetical protein